ncbi:hypothetical protein BGW80DRAFT_1457169 [Lactifluus volemus]|nr:hypothetical protein BGW80DRAFT_1457169 [Lactifluus volemus]
MKEVALTTPIQMDPFNSPPTSIPNHLDDATTTPAYIALTDIPDYYYSQSIWDVIHPTPLCRLFRHGGLEFHSLLHNHWAAEGESWELKRIWGRLLCRTSRGIYLDGHKTLIQTERSAATHVLSTLTFYLTNVGLLESHAAWYLDLPPTITSLLYVHSTDLEIRCVATQSLSPWALHFLKHAPASRTAQNRTDALLLPRLRHPRF